MECEEEELEPWQKAIPEINLIDDDDDDDEPIFVGEIQSSKAVNSRPSTGIHRGQQSLPGGRRNQGSFVQSMQKPSQTLGPKPGSFQSSNSGPSSNQMSAQNTSRLGNTTAPQPIIINNQGYMVSSPQLSNSVSFITAGQSSTPSGGAIHRPQVQHIQNNVVTLSNVHSPTDMDIISQQSPGRQHRQQNPLPIVSPPHRRGSSSLTSPHHSPVALSSLQGLNNRDNGTVKRHTLTEFDQKTKRLKFDSEGPLRVTDILENGSSTKHRCPRCVGLYPGEDSLKGHMRYCCPDLLDGMLSPVATATSSRPDKPSMPVRMYDADKGKLIMLVADFYYGRSDGDQHIEQKTNTTFKCNSCLKVLKNNIRFMNHMKHHLELEKQNSESWESHTTCQHCYRQYSTPFQLQCHIESAHSPYESTTNCKICELAFDTEQVLLEHMKDNHKPGEMPYACQVCNYRSSFFSEVETHFRSVHDNTKDLLCPFCLKVLRSGHMYMQHYMRHQKKGIHRCGKCRLNFLTYKEKIEHKTLFHRTFRKPRTLEGLPPGTKVTIRASLAGSSPTSPGTFSKSSISVIPGSPTAKPLERPPVAASRSKPPSVQNQNQTRNNPPPQKTKKERGKPANYRNFLLRNFRPTQKVKCSECLTEVQEFYDHYPLLLSCGACKFKTCCRRAYRNHLSRFHGAGSRDRKQKSGRMQGRLTLVCLNCDLLVDSTGTDIMSKHLIDRPNHVCKVIIEETDHPKENQDSVSDRSSIARCDSQIIIVEDSQTEAAEELESKGGNNGTVKEVEEAKGELEKDKEEREANVMILQSKEEVGERGAPDEDGGHGDEVSASTKIDMSPPSMDSGDPAAMAGQGGEGCGLERSLLAKEEMETSSLPGEPERQEDMAAGTEEQTDKTAEIKEQSVLDTDLGGTLEEIDTLAKETIEPENTGTAEPEAVTEGEQEMTSEEPNRGPMEQATNPEVQDHKSIDSSPATVN